jgi:hypothetical protein
MPRRRRRAATSPVPPPPEERPRKRARLDPPIDVDAEPIPSSHASRNPSPYASAHSTPPATPNTPGSPLSLSTEERNRVNNAELEEALQTGLRLHQESQRPNTRKAYKGPQKKWIAWCNEKQFSDGCIVENRKLLAFVQQVVMKRRVEKKKRRKATAKKEDIEEISVEDEADAAIIDSLQHLDLPDPEFHEGAPLKYHTIRSYVSAIMELYQIQVAQGLNPHLSPRNMAVKGFLRSIRDNVWKATREGHEDRALNSIMDGYTHEDISAFVRNCYQKKKSSERHLRTALDFLIGHYLLLRGDIRRKLELADLNVIDFPDEGLQPCKAWVCIFDNGKTNSTGKKQYMGVMRHKDVEVCAQGTLAQYLFNRYQIQEEAWPDFSSPAKWDANKLLRGAGPQVTLDPTTQRKWARACFDDIGVDVEKPLHVGRKRGAHLADIQGVHSDDVSVQVHLVSRAFVDCFTSCRFAALGFGMPMLCLQPT